MNTQINMNELEEDHLKKIKKNNTIYLKVLHECHRKIKFNSKLNRKYCFFLIPEFIFGTPLYDIKELRKFTIYHLERNGFKVAYVDPNWLFITWEIKTKKYTPQNKPNTPKNDYRPVEEYKPSGTFNSGVYDDATLLAMQDKTRTLNL
tara:strand:- start:3669 stop:4112 length:444 start_codon:yes stop_codon:yes gene_type:complete